MLTCGPKPRGLWHISSVDTMGDVPQVVWATLVG